MSKIKIQSWAQYVKLAHRTAAPAADTASHYLKGLVTECAELLDLLKKMEAYGAQVEDLLHEFRLELGDVCWYMANLHRLLQPFYTKPLPSHVIMEVDTFQQASRSRTTYTGDFVDVWKSPSEATEDMLGYLSTALEQVFEAYGASSSKPRPFPARTHAHELLQREWIKFTSMEAKHFGFCSEIFEQSSFSSGRFSNWQRSLICYEAAAMVVVAGVHVLAVNRSDDLPAAEKYQLAAGEVLNSNIAKLYQRYPEQFDSYLAMNRDVQAENEATEVSDE